MSIREFKDSRGTFIPYDVKDWDQANVVISHHKYTFRGMHYQTNPSQTKLVKIIQGSALDFLYNLKTKEVKIYKLDSSSDPLEIGKDYAHGYFTLEPNTIFTYLVKGEYNPQSEHSIIYDTIPFVNAHVKLAMKEHGKGELHISNKDKQGK